MSVPPPPERPSLYPPPHRAGGWEPAPPPRGPRWWIAIAIVATLGLLVVVAMAGLAVGRAIGTADVMIDDPDGESINAIQVTVGTCLTSVPSNGSVGTVEAVPCSERHVAEAVASYTFPGDDWPGREAATSTLLDFCGAFVQPGFGADAMFQPGDWNAGLRWVAWAPTEESWDTDERTGLCVVYRDAGLQGSFIARTATFVG